MNLGIRSKLAYWREPRLFPLQKHGFDLNTYNRYNRSWMKNIPFGTILDVGASTGATALMFRQVFPNAQIHAFEPLPNVFQELQAKSALIGHFKAYNVALGDRSGTVTFQENDFHYSSSILEVGDLHKTIYPHTANTREVEVKLEKLDNFRDVLNLEKPVLLKLDVQGYEAQVLLGAKELLEKVDVIITETSLVELYKGQLLFADILTLLISLGFRYAGSLDQLISPADRTILQQDAIFVRSSTLA